MNQTRPRRLDRIFQVQLQTLATVLSPSTIRYYRTQAHRFLRFLHDNHPEVRTAGQLRRTPHILGWLRGLSEENPPLTNRSRRAALMCVRRLFHDLIDNGYPLQEGLILRQDFPPPDLYLAKPLSLEVDRLLDQQLRSIDDILSNGLLLLRATGIRIGECLRLQTDSLRYLGDDRWAVHVPLGKLHNERWVPIDDRARLLFDRILLLTRATPIRATDPARPLLALPGGLRGGYCRMRKALLEVAQRAGCPPIRLHQLRHTYATEMVRAGISLPALKQILGHKDIRMTLWYVQVTQTDLQREYHLARQRIASLHQLPQLPQLRTVDLEAAGIPAICRALAAVQHQLEMYRRQLAHNVSARQLARLAKRLTKLRTALAQFETTPK